MKDSANTFDRNTMMAGFSADTTGFPHKSKASTDVEKKLDAKSLAIQNCIEKICFDFGAEGGYHYVINDFKTVVNYILILDHIESNEKHSKEQERFLHENGFWHYRRIPGYTHLSLKQIKQLQNGLFYTYRERHPYFCTIAPYLMEKYAIEIAEIKSKLTDPWLIFFAFHFCERFTSKDVALLQSNNESSIAEAFQNVYCSPLMARSLVSARLPMAKLSEHMLSDEYLKSSAGVPRKPRKRITQVIAYAPYRVYSAQEFFQK